MKRVAEMRLENVQTWRGKGMVAETTTALTADLDMLALSQPRAMLLLDH
jgi:hypothetical protein